MSTATALKEGDVFNFRYSPEVRAKARGDLNWCFDGQVVVRDGKLVDTYWCDTKQDRAWGDARVVKPEDGELTFVCNLNDVRDIHESERRYYAEGVVLNLSAQHGCYKRFVVPKDAERDADAMKEWLRDEMGKKRRDIGHATDALERLAVQFAAVERGDTSGYIG